MALIRGRERKDAAAIFTASMADIVFLLIVFFVLTYKVEVDRTKMDLPDTWMRIKVPEKAAVISIAPPDDLTAADEQQRQHRSEPNGESRHCRHHTGSSNHAQTANYGNDATERGAFRRRRSPRA